MIRTYGNSANIDRDGGRGMNGVCVMEYIPKA
jgi:hypothetical protein